MLAALHEVPVQAGDAVLVPAGTLHAIGGGILLLELQEPTDLSVLVEWKRFGVDSGPEHLDLGWDTALQSLDHEPIDPAALTTARERPPADRGRSLLPRREGRGRRHARPRASRSCSSRPAKDEVGEVAVSARGHGAGPLRRRARP